MKIGVEMFSFSEFCAALFSSEYAIDDIDQIAESTPLEELGFDSLQWLEMINKCEELAGYLSASLEAPEVRNVGDAYKYYQFCFATNRRPPTARR
jgi:acyl carrier protein